MDDRGCKWKVGTTMKLLTDLTVESATEAQLTEALFIITNELDKRLQEGRTPLAFRIVIKDTSN